MILKFLLKVKVEIYLVFLKLGDIETLSEKFQADLLIEAKWKEPRLQIDVNLDKIILILTKFLFNLL